MTGRRRATGLLGRPTDRRSELHGPHFGSGKSADRRSDFHGPKSGSGRSADRQCEFDGLAGTGHPCPADRSAGYLPGPGGNLTEPSGMYGLELLRVMVTAPALRPRQAVPSISLHGLRGAAGPTNELW